MGKQARAVITTRLTWRAIFPIEMASGNWQKLPSNASSCKEHVLNADLDISRLRASMVAARLRPGDFRKWRNFGPPCAPGFCQYLYFPTYCSKLQDKEARIHPGGNSASPVNLAYLHKQKGPRNAYPMQNPPDLVALGSGERSAGGGH